MRIIAALLLAVASAAFSAEPSPPPVPAPLSAEEAKRLDTIAALLSHDDAAEREAAQKELEAWALSREREPALAELRARLEKAQDPETRARLSDVVERIVPTSFRSGDLSAAWKGDREPIQADRGPQDEIRLRGTGTIRVEGAGSIRIAGKGLEVRSFTYAGKGKATVGKGAFSTARIGTKDATGSTRVNQGLTSTEIEVEGKGEVVVKPGGIASVSLAGGPWKLELEMKGDCVISDPVPPDRPKTGK